MKTMQTKSRQDELVLIAFILLLTIGCELAHTLHSGGDINPYKVLGIPRNADEKQIKLAYRKLAKDWHPDKNKMPEASEKFMEINQAYEILIDPEKRSLYDEYGQTSESRNGPGGFQWRTRQGDFFFEDAFDDFFARRFNQRQRTKKNPEDEINKKIYEDEILPNSHTKPFLIYSYTDFCFACMTVDSTWQEFKQEIRKIGFGVGHSDAAWNRELSRQLGVTTVPSLVGIVNGRVKHFQDVFTLKALRQFVRSLMPPRLVRLVSRDSFNTTMAQAIAENKVFALFISKTDQLTLRFQMPCLQMSNFIKCAYINSNSIDESFKSYLESNYNLRLSIGKETIVIFKETMFTTNKNILNYNVLSELRGAKLRVRSRNI